MERDEIALFYQVQSGFFVPRCNNDRSVLAAGQIFAQWFGCRLGASSLHIEQKASIVDIVQYEQPWLIGVAHPVMHQLKDVDLRILSSFDLDTVGDVAEAQLEPGGAAGMRPQYPRPWQRLARAVAVLDGQLRLAVSLLDEIQLPTRGPVKKTYPTPPTQTLASRDACTEHLSRSSSSSVPLSTKSGSRQKGITQEGRLSSRCAIDEGIVSNAWYCKVVGIC